MNKENLHQHYCVLSKVCYGTGGVTFEGTLDETKQHVLYQARGLLCKEFWRTSWCIIRDSDKRVVCTVVPQPNEHDKFILSFHFAKTIETWSLEPRRVEMTKLADVRT